MQAYFFGTPCKCNVSETEAKAEASASKAKAMTEACLSIYQGQSGDISCGHLQLS